MDGKHNNSNKSDGFVYGCRSRCSLIPKGVKTKLQPHVFVRNNEGGNYKYLGKGLYEARYDENRNKIFLKGEK